MESHWLMISVLVVSLSTLVYTIISNYAIRGNDLKHLKEAITCMETKLLKRIERLEDIFIKGGKG